METVTGYVSHIVYRNSDNGYTVFHIEHDDGEVTCVGSLNYINEGELLEIQGEYVNHNVYGKQLKISHYKVKEPEDIVSIERYLGSGAVKGVGAALAGRIVKKFKEDTFRIIEEEPERLAEIKGISERKAQEIASQLEEKKDMRKAMMFLQRYGIQMNLANKIFKRYGNDIYNILEQNPYRLADDIEGVGFRTADEIASRAGIKIDSEFRIKSGIFYVLNQATMQGHIYLPYDKLVRQVNELLLIDVQDYDKYLMDLTMDKKIVVKVKDNVKCVYARMYYNMEANVAAMLNNLDVQIEEDQKFIDDRIARIEDKEGINLDDIQKEAVAKAVRNGLVIVTGGPGTGKTTTINTIIKYFELEGLEIRLAAPTGRAAKRMTEACGYEAQTIHRMLEISGGVPDGDRKSAAGLSMFFERNEDNPLEADVIIVDEMSMVDIFLFHNLLKAIAVGTRLILVGDVNQLPSVGPGNVLRDVINSHCFNVVRLSHIFRQAAESDIIVNAHRIHRGEEIALDNQSKDFFCLKRDDSHGVLEVMLWLVRDRMPKYTHCTPFDVQVLTPMKKGELGVRRCNEVLQRYLNPEAPGKNQMELHGVLFREGDKVMQMKNNYQIKWEIRGYNHMMIEEGSGVFNGDCGIITEIDTFNKEVTVRFDDEKYVTYPQGNLDELELAYAITIHKSQGSEYPAVVLPILSGPRPLMNRNILYTAVTRGKKCVTIVGNKDTVREMIQNKSEQMRYSSLCRRLQELEQESLEK